MPKLGTSCPWSQKIQLRQKSPVLQQKRGQYSSCPHEGVLLAELWVRDYVSLQPTKAALLAEALHKNPLHHCGWTPAVS